MGLEARAGIAVQAAEEDKLDEAIKTLAGVTAEMTRVFGKGHNVTCLARINLAHLLAKRGDYVRALEQRRADEESARENDAKDNDRLAEAMCGVSSVLWRLGRDEEAAAKTAAAIAMRRRLNSEGDENAQFWWRAAILWKGLGPNRGGKAPP